MDENSRKRIQSEFEFNNYSFFTETLSIYPGQLLCIIRIDLSVFRVTDGLMESMNVKAVQSGAVLLNRRRMKVVGFLIGRSVIVVISPY